MKKLLALALLLVACGATASSTDNTDASNLPSKDGSAEASGDGGGVCCPADPGPGCCMKYGGWSGDGNCFGQICDGMPVPSDPGWKLVKDDHGCSMWSNASPNWGSNACGAPVKKDASADAPTKD